MDTELVTRLRAVIHRLARVLNATSTGEDLTPTQYSVLALVRVRGPLGLTELTELEGINPTMLSRVVKVLDERGLIRRMQDPGDLRAARVAVTPEGEQVHDRVRALRTKVLSDCLHGLPAGTTAALLAAVPDLEALAEALKPPAKPVRGCLLLAGGTVTRAGEGGLLSDAVPCGPSRHPRLPALARAVISD